MSWLLRKSFCGWRCSGRECCNVSESDQSVPQRTRRHRRRREDAQSFPNTLRIKREAALCIDCGKCTRACPSSPNVAQSVTIQSAECTTCLCCFASCPVDSARYMSVAGRRNCSAILHLRLAQWTGDWNTILPEKVYTELVPQHSSPRQLRRTARLISAARIGFQIIPCQRKGPRPRPAADLVILAVPALPDIRGRLPKNPKQA